MLAGLVAAHLAAARGFFRTYPHTYSWTELLIDYRGGFSKRGLLGEIAFQARHVVAPRRLLVDAVAGAYILGLLGEVLVMRLCDGYAGLLFLASPVGGLFPLINPGNYGRKDAFVIAAVVGGMLVAAHARRRWLAMIAPMALFGAVGFIVEIVWFYYPLVFAATLALRRDEPLRWRLGASAAAALYTAGCFGSTLALPHVDTAAIARSWGAPPFDTDTTGALCCLNLRIADAVVIAEGTLPNLGGYALGLAAGLLPLACLFLRRPPVRADVLTHAVALFGIVFAMSPVAIAADWGRYIVLWLTATFLWAWTASSRECAPRGRDAGLEGVLLRAALLVLYAGTWQLVGWQSPDRSAVLPGLLFKAIDSTTPEPFSEQF